MRVTVVALEREDTPAMAMVPERPPIAGDKRLISLFTRNSAVEWVVLIWVMRNGPYVLIVAPPDYPGRKYRNRYAYEHIVEFWKKTGALPRPGFVVHHQNEDKHDNA